LHQRQERWELRKKIFVAEKERLLRELDYVKKNIAGQRTQQAKGKLRRLSREVQAIKSLGVDVVKSQNWARVSAQAELTAHTLSVAEVERLIRGLKEPSSYLPQFSMHLRAQSRSGDLVLRTKKLLIGYQDDNEVLFEAPDLLIKREECVALIGPNGAGKTTFLKTLLGELPPLDGEVILGAGLNIGYFAQAHEDLSPELTLVDEIWKVAPNMLLPDVRSYLARFLFRKEDAFKKVAVLSGGERGRLALAKLALENANLLLLDEPTNHLDIPSQEILQDVLAVYPGTMLLVSHDRYLIDALATQIWEISPEKRKLRVFQGSYSQYREHLEKTADVEKGIRTRKKKNQKPERHTGRKNNRKLLARLNEIEESITTLEDKLNGVSKQLENPSDNHFEVEKLGAEYVAIEKEINNLMQEWEALHAEIA
jgi:ATP-binding cassette subfamily F protein 3